MSFVALLWSRGRRWNRGIGLNPTTVATNATLTTMVVNYQDQTLGVSKLSAMAIAVYGLPKIGAILLDRANCGRANV